MAAVIKSSQCVVSPSATASSLELKYRKKVARPISAACAICSTVAPARPFSATDCAAAEAMRARVAFCLRTVRLSREFCRETTSMMRLCLTMDEIGNGWAPKTLEAWRFVQQVLADVTQTVIDDAMDERELLEGLRVIAKVTGLCTELAVEADGERPRFLDMCSDARMIGGPNPDGRYLLAMIRGDRTYRVTGTRGSTAYLGFQMLAGTGLTPRRMAGYLSDTDPKLRSGSFALVLSASAPPADILGAAQWIPIPPDASSIVVREYIGDASA